MKDENKHLQCTLLFKRGRKFGVSIDISAFIVEYGSLGLVLSMSFNTDSENRTGTCILQFFKHIIKSFWKTSGMIQ